MFTSGCWSSAFSALLVLWCKVFPWNPHPRVLSGNIKLRVAVVESRQAVDLSLSWLLGEWLCVRHFNQLSLRLLIFKMGLVATIVFNYSFTIWLSRGRTGSTKTGTWLFFWASLPRCGHVAGTKRGCIRCTGGEYTQDRYACLQCGCEAWVSEKCLAHTRCPLSPALWVFLFP